MTPTYTPLDDSGVLRLQRVPWCLAAWECSLLVGNIPTPNLRSTSSVTVFCHAVYIAATNPIEKNYTCSDPYVGNLLVVLILCAPQRFNSSLDSTQSTAPNQPSLLSRCANPIDINYTCSDPYAGNLLVVLVTLAGASKLHLVFA